MEKSSGKKYVIALAIVIFLIISNSLHAQTGQTVSGTIKKATTGEPIPFANIALLNATDSTMAGGSISDIKGVFVIDRIIGENYRLRLSAVGFETLFMELNLKNEPGADLGEIVLRPTKIAIEGVEIVGERIKAMNKADKTVFNVNSKMQDASTTGTDVLKLIPGVQVDLMQNVSIEGSKDVLILVNGRERDRNFLGRLSAKQIDQIEVISNPSSGYAGEVNGVVNIVLKPNEEAGLDGHVHLEIPTSASETYLFPAFSMNYGFKKLNIYTSYSGELAYLDIEEKLNRKIFDPTGFEEITSTQIIQQKNWSHRFHYGLDFMMNKKNRINFYGFYNPYSWEHDGQVALSATGNESRQWLADKDDSDLNHAAFYSLYYKHIFDEKNEHEISADAGLYTLNGENTTTFTNIETADILKNAAKPQQLNVGLKLDHKIAVGRKINVNSGFQLKMSELEDQLNSEFSWKDEIMAAYTEVNFDHKNFNLLAGFRMENSTAEISDQGSENYLVLLPAVTLNYKMANSQNLRLSYRKGIARPGQYQLNPAVYRDDPFSIRSGNPDLQPAVNQNIHIEHSKKFENSFLATRIFYQQTSGAINTFTHLNSEGIFETNTCNLGTLHRYGLQFTGAFSIGKIFSINPYLRLFEIQTDPNAMGLESGLGKNRKPAMESGFSAIASLKHNITASVLFHYNTPVHQMQRTTFSGALYFVSLDKKFCSNFKAGITSGIPFSKSFVYNGYEIENNDFSVHSEGTVKMSVVPVWFKLTYQFSSGKGLSKMQREVETIEQAPKKGF
jgi:hypothetical protein